MNLLEQCARSGQLSAAQINQHEQAGEMSLSRLALHRVPDAVGYESAQPSLVKAPRAAVAPLLDGPYRPKRKPESALSI